jgi:hypothetical protein
MGDYERRGADVFGAWGVINTKVLLRGTIRLVWKRGVMSGIEEPDSWAAVPWEMAVWPDGAAGGPAALPGGGRALAPASAVL